MTPNEINWLLFCLKPDPPSRLLLEPRGKLNVALKTTGIRCDSISRTGQYK
jgi:hypothetical protein